MNTDIPPILGIGAECIFLEFGASMAPIFLAKRITNGVNTNEDITVIAKDINIGIIFSENITGPFRFICMKKYLSHINILFLVAMW
jgi:hypothetical protein